MTQYLGVLGFPLKHSLSPIFQQAALDYYGLDIRYQVWEVKPGGLGRAIEQLRQPQNLGANVTIPYKEAVLPFLDGLDEQSRAIGAVNTIVKEKGLKGYNTDAPGFLKALTDAGFQPKGKNAVILGAGGAARAVAWALIRERIASLTIFNRTPERGEGLVAWLKPFLKPGQNLKAFPWEEKLLREVLPRSQLLVNTTPLGMKHSPGEGQSPLKPELVPPDAFIYDLVYNPEETPLIGLAKQKGAKTLGGLRMLVYQGALSFRLWTGRDAPLEVMWEAARRALKKAEA